MFDVKGYGARGDDTSDDTAAVQHAIDTAVSAGGGSVYFPAGSYHLTRPARIPPGAGVILEGDGIATTRLRYTGSGTALVIGSASASTLFPGVRRLTIDFAGASDGTHAIVAVRTHFMVLHEVRITSVTGARSMGTAITIDGEGDWSGNSDWHVVQVTGNWAVGVDLKGPATNTCNNHQLRHLSVTRGTTKPGTGTVGVRFDARCGDNFLFGPDVEGYDVGYQIAGRFTRGFVRVENCTTGVELTDSSSNNWIVQSGFTLTRDSLQNGFNNTLIRSEDFRLGQDANGDLHWRMRNVRDANTFISMRAGDSTDRIAALRFTDRRDAVRFEWRKTALNAFQLISGTAAGRNQVRIALRDEADDDVEIRGAGSGRIRLNRDSSGQACGSGGVEGGDGRANGPATWSIAGNGTAAFAGLRLTRGAGRFTMAAAPTRAIADGNVTAASQIFLTATNAAAGRLMGGPTTLYIAAKTAATGFTVATANGEAAIGSETFDYLIVN